MIRLGSISAILFISLLSSIQASANGTDKELRALVLLLKNIKSEQGKIYIAVFNDERSFMKSRYKEEAVTVNSLDDIEVELKLPDGKYAISIFHDTNNNGKLNTNFMGIPKEPYGFSNNPKTTFGPPNFEKASFDLSANQTIKITLN